MADASPTWRKIDTDTDFCCPLFDYEEEMKISSRGLAVIVAPLVIFKLCWYRRDISAVELLTQSTADQLTPLSFTPATSRSTSDSSDACHEAY